MKGKWRRRWKRRRMRRRKKRICEENKGRKGRKL